MYLGPTLVSQIYSTLIRLVTYVFSDVSLSIDNVKNASFVYEKV